MLDWWCEKQTENYRGSGRSRVLDLHPWCRRMLDVGSRRVTGVGTVAYYDHYSECAGKHHKDHIPE
jgi:hypothetical protein